jgi:hypothetical protein
LDVLVPEAEVCQYHVTPEGAEPEKVRTEFPQLLTTVGVLGVPGAFIIVAVTGVLDVVVHPE